VNPERIYLVDGIGPFFRGCDRRRINWSKILFEDLQRDGTVDDAKFGQIGQDFDRFCAQAARAGFNGVTLDDVAHLADSPRYPGSVRGLIEGYRRNFAGLFRIAALHGLDVYLTTDVMYFHRDAPEAAGRTREDQARFLAGCLADVFASFEEVRGVIVRIGESDGLDVCDAFRSKLSIRTPGQCRRLLGALLPVCERHGRTLVFRTWSVGAYRIGDLIWNRVTFRRVFERLDSPNLVVSMKYGESDFFRHLPLNRHFFRGPQRKMIELQARREYEGCGEYPSFIGEDYERYRDELREGGARLAGVMVWCQTGGWTSFRRLTWVERSSVWNEINAWVTLRLFRDGMTCGEAVDDWCRAHDLGAFAHNIRPLLQLSAEAIHEGLYIDDFAEQKLFFRRLRVPPLLWVFWDQILVTPALSRLLDCFVRDGRRQMRRGESALARIAEMRRLAARSGLPHDDMDFMYDTFEVFAAARAYFFLPDTARQLERLHETARAYQAKHPVHYAVRLEAHGMSIRRKGIQRILRLAFRRQRGYRWIDRLFTLRLLSLAYPLLKRWRLVPALADRRAMGLDAVLR
jgi:hypothetical protein